MPYTKNSNPFQIYKGDVDNLDMPKSAVTSFTPKNTPICDVAFGVKEVQGSDTRSLSDQAFSIFALMDLAASWEVVPVQGENIFDKEIITTQTRSQDTINAPQDWEDVVDGDSDGSPVRTGDYIPYAGEATRYTFKIRVKFKEMTTQSKTITEMLGWFNARYQDMTKISVKDRYLPHDNVMENEITSTIDTKYKKLLVGMMKNPTSE